MVPMLVERDEEFGWFEGPRKQTLDLRLKARCRRRDVAIVILWTSKRDRVSLSLYHSLRRRNKSRLGCTGLRLLTVEDANPRNRFQ